MTVYLSADEVKTINQRFLGGPALRDKAGLLAALARPLAAAYYEQADLAMQAAVLIEGIAMAQAFVDANKRTATAAGLVFLRLNGYHVDYLVDPAQDEMGQQVLVLVTHAVRVDAFAQWLRARLVPNPT